MTNKIKILHLENRRPDAEMVERELKKGNFFFEKLVVSRKADFVMALEEFSPDVILCDHMLPSFDSLEAVRIIKKSGNDIPVILVTGTVSEEFAVEIMKAGVYDYVFKDRLQRLPLALLNAIDKRRTDIKYQSTYEKLYFHLENTPLGFIEWDNQLHIRFLSKRAEEIFGWSFQDFTENERTGYSQVYEEDQPRLYEVAEQLLNGKMDRNNVQHRNYTKDGRVIWCHWFNSVLKNKDGKVITIMSMVHDVTEQKIAESNSLHSYPPVILL